MRPMVSKSPRGINLSSDGRYGVSTITSGSPGVILLSEGDGSTVVDEESTLLMLLFSVVGDDADVGSSLVSLSLLLFVAVGALVASRSIGISTTLQDELPSFPLLAAAAEEQTSNR